MVTLNTDRNKQFLESLLTYGSIPFWGLVLYYAYSQLMPRGQYGVAFLGGILLLYIVNELIDVIEAEDYASLAALIGSALVVIPVMTYIFTNFNALNSALGGRTTTLQLGMSLAFTIVMAYLTYRAFGITFLTVLLAGIGYGLFGNLIPGVLSHSGLTWQRVLRVLLIDVSGFIGQLNKLTAAWIAPFLLYAGLLKAYGGFDLIMQLSIRSAKYLSSGVAQTAVVASAVVGSINGSQTANASMTGSITIPMMKKSGVKPKSSGGIEAVASTSGQVLPPVMGAGAFIMASLISGITYFDVIASGLIPAVILVVTIVIAVHYVASKQVEDTSVQQYLDDPMPRSEMLLDAITYAVPLILLVYLLGFAGYTIMTGALATAVSMMIMGTIVPMGHQGYRVATGKAGTNSLLARAKTILIDTRDGFREGAVVLAPVAIILAAIGGVVDILLATAVPTSISLALLDLSGGQLWVAAILGMIISILLGLGMPTTAAYTIVALLVAPAFVSDFNMPEFSAHFFVFYAAILAGLTPPIATCVAVTTGIAGSDFWETSIEAIKISAPLFILPFSFLYHPEIVAGNFTPTALASGGIALAGAVVMIHGINFPFELDNRLIRWIVRAGFFVVGLATMVHPAGVIRYGALITGIAFLVAHAFLGAFSPVRGIKTAISTAQGGADTRADGGRK